MKNQRAIVKRTSQIIENGQDVIVQMGCGTVVHFKRLGSRHIHKEIEIPLYVFGIDEIISKTGLKPIQTLTHKCNIINE